MRKLLLSVLAVALIAGMAVSAHSANLTQVYPITVTFVADEIDLVTTGTPLATWGDVGASQNMLSNLAGGEIRHSVTQQGYAQIDFTAIATCVSGWTLAGTIGANTADNTAVLACIFTEAVETGTPSRLLVIGDFGDEDVLAESTSVQATIDNLARNNALADPDDVDAIKGFSVPDLPGNNAERSARYVLQTPPTVSGTGVNQQTITITIGAVAL